MTIPGGTETNNHSSNAVMYFCGAAAMLMFAILAFGNASEWFDYVSAAIWLGLAVVLGYRGFRPGAV
ncbi:hypothetical protein N2K95_14835 [Arthrobacter zhaoxinii]|uniref:Uncharacterized protein n=1 Tax=Arthrobacter zhaoxinii TaxID=2964616 RepID=A0ABY5YPZ8_9MICC|nr:hypothetical protein [Arthrobacter zhaoxinii]UWX96890.1 hypothetical protein N2K95_14835 [Arthrobacter zhaoxinii]